jgi:hypothetical protein
MVEQAQRVEKPEAGEFERQAGRAGKRSTSPIGEFWYLVVRTRKYWMLPILLAMLTVGFLIATGGTAIAPLIYTLF